MNSHTQNTTLHSIILKLTPDRASLIRATHGHHAHAAFLQAVRQVDPELAEALHNPALSVKPFTVSPLLETGPGHEGAQMVAPTRDYALRFTTLLEPVFQQFMACFLHGSGRLKLELGHATFHIREIMAAPGSHPWTGYSSFVELAQRAEPSERVTLDFSTPTAFSFGKKSWGRQVVPLPWPRLVFGSLARSWNTYAPPELALDPQALRAYLEDDAVVAGLSQVETRMLAYRNGPQLGFVGRVTFEFKGRDEALRCQLNALSDFAFYSGVGYKTPMGMGQCRRIEGHYHQQESHDG